MLKFIVSDDVSVSFNVEVCGAKSWKDFYEHEKHLPLTKDQLKEVHDIMRKQVKKDSSPPLTDPENLIPE